MINRIFLALVILFGTISLKAQETFFVKIKDEISKSEINSFIESKSFETATPGGNSEYVKIKPLHWDHFVRDSRIGRILKVETNSEENKSLLISQIEIDPLIEYVQENTVYSIDFIPNDSLYADQWGLKKIGAEDAWEISQGNENILITIIDTGIDLVHPDLKPKLFVNPAEDINGNGQFDESDINGIDEDGNGFIDDISGWDFTDRVGFPFNPDGGDYLGWDNDPNDEQGHGTYVSGIAAAQTNNISGVAGVAPNCKILNLRAFDPSGFGEEDDVAAAILYAVDMGSKVINMSFGDNSFSYILRDVIKYAYSQGVVLVGSAGNSASNLPHYPSGYSEVISIGSSTENDFVSSFSNSGSTIDMVAPGSSIRTTQKGSGYTFVNGTSTSAPFVSGASALLLSVNPDYTNEEIKQILKTTSDDIGSAGWDEKSGAGRLNLKRAMEINAPSKIKFNSPLQDFATSGNQIEVSATILSAYFQSYQLLYGVGLNPENWTTLIENGRNQFSNQNIHTIDVSSFTDSSYTLRLVVLLNNGRTMEERVNFHVDRSAPELQLVNLGPAYYGEESTIFASVFTNEVSVTKLFYKKKAESEFKFISLDGFSTNNQFVKQLHYGFIPKDLVEPDTEYDIYFEAENLVGLKTVVNVDNNNTPLSSKTDASFSISSYTKMDYTLPPGTLFKEPVSIQTIDNSEILINKFSSPRYLHQYELLSNQFIIKDSLFERIPKSFGDFNNNGQMDLLSLFVRNGYIDEQDGLGTGTFANRFSDETGNDFWPILAEDLDLDGFTEALVVKDDTTLQVWQMDLSLNLTLESELVNYTDVGFFGNTFDAPSASIADLNNDGIREIWVVDSDGDIFSFEIGITPNTYNAGSVIRTDFIGSKGNLSAGDFDGDGSDELAVLLQSSSQLDIAPFHLLVVFNLLNETFNVLYNKAFIDPSSEFSTSFQNAETSIRLANVDRDNQSELLIFAFPYSYLIKNVNGEKRILYYQENVNSSTVFVGDLNKNGINEVAFPTEQIIEFLEFDVSNKPPIPFGLSGYSEDSTTIKLKWFGEGSKYFIYRGTSSDNLVLLDSTNLPEFTDLVQISNQDYYYSIKSFDESKPEPLSNFSRTIRIYAHKPAEMISANSFSRKSVTIGFSQKVKNTIENLNSFEIIGFGIPNSVTANSEFSYVLNYTEDLPLGEHNVAIKDLRDLYNSPVSEDTLKFTVSEIQTGGDLFIQSYQLLNNNQIKIIFNLDIDQTGVFVKENYQFSPANIVTEVIASPNEMNSVTLVTTNPVGSIGREYQLQIKNLNSTAATGAVPINKGAGSFIVISSFSSDLSDIYVYPNPVRLSESNKITFANLTKNAEIIIFTIEGKRVVTLNESDGNGGLEWDLKNEDGETISSGIYVYRIVSLDDTNNEIEEKLEKFAVIR